MKVSEVLKKAKALIEKPEKWTTREYARDTDGVRVKATDGRAVCFCALGAVRKVLGHDADGTYASLALHAATVETDWVDVPTANDASNGGHSLVMSIFDKAIANAEKKEASREDV